MLALTIHVRSYAKPLLHSVGIPDKVCTIRVCGANRSFWGLTCVYSVDRAEASTTYRTGRLRSYINGNKDERRVVFAPTDDVCQPHNAVSGVAQHRYNRDAVKNTAAVSNAGVGGP